MSQQTEQSSPQVTQFQPRASRRSAGRDSAGRCSADPACVWPIAAAGLCVHHYRMFREPDAVSGTMLGSANGAEAEPQQQLMPAATSAALRASPLADRNAPPAVETTQNGGPGQPCRNPSCRTRLGSNNRSGLCKRCGDRVRAFNVRRARRGAARWLSFEQYVAARDGLRM